MLQRPEFVARSAVTAVFSLAAPAKEWCADVFRASLLVENPGKDLPWRIVPDVLRVSALELCDPFVLKVLMKANDALLAHASSNGRELAEGEACTARTPTNTSRPPRSVDRSTVSPSSATADSRVTRGSRYRNAAT
jgi:hypothetical protein